MALEPHDRLATRQGGHGRRKCQLECGDAKGPAAGIGRQRHGHSCAAASDPTPARPRVTESDRDLLRRVRSGRARRCGAYVEIRVPEVGLWDVWMDSLIVAHPVFPLAL